MAKQQGFFASCQVEGSLGIGDVTHDLANWQTPMAKPKITRQYGEERTGILQETFLHSLHDGSLMC